MLLRWFPWKLVVSRVARAKGLVDPVRLLSRLESFAQPLEVKEPLELLRAGMVFHARGLLNTGAIQHNLDWIWPYWVERQYDPLDESFVPRAFSMTHINLTHRNWTAIGLPDCEEIPIVDPRGLVTPFWDGWSLDAWIAREDGGWLVPSRSREAIQWQRVEPSPAVITRTMGDGLELETLAEVVDDVGIPKCELAVRARAEADAYAWLVIALRPYNPEGVSFIHEIDAAVDGARLSLAEGRSVEFDPAPLKLALSDYRHLPSDTVPRSADGTTRCRPRFEPTSPTRAGSRSTTPRSGRSSCTRRARSIPGRTRTSDSGSAMPRSSSTPSFVRG
jgi:hypothetical protein